MFHTNNVSHLHWRCPDVNMWLFYAHNAFYLKALPLKFPWCLCPFLPGHYWREVVLLWPETEGTYLQWLLPVTVALFTQTLLDRLTANAHRAILRYALSLARTETQLRSGAQNSSTARNRESGWTSGRTGLLWLKSHHFVLVFMPCRWYWCIFMQ